MLFTLLIMTIRQIKILAVKIWEHMALVGNTRVFKI